MSSLDTQVEFSREARRMAKSDEPDDAKKAVKVPVLSREKMRGEKFRTVQP